VNLFKSSFLDEWSVVLTSALVFAVSLAAPLEGAIYYVDQKHSNASDANPGTENAPWKTIGKAAGQAMPGDLVWIKAGTYHETIQVKHAGRYYASEIQFITFAAFGDDEVIIDGTREILRCAWTPVAGMRNVFSCSLGENPGQIFVDGKRFPAAIEIVNGKRVAFEITDSTPNRWTWDQRKKRLLMNTDGGNPSDKHKVEATVYGVYLDPPTADQPGLRYGGRGTHGDYIRLHGLHFHRIREILSYGGFHCVEDCVIREAGGAFAVIVPGIVRRDTIIDSLHQAIYWPSNSVIEDNLIVGTSQDPTILSEDYLGVLKANGGSYSTVRNNIILDTARHPGFPEGPPAIWGDTTACYNALYGNVCVGHSIGIYIEKWTNYNVVAFNACLENNLGIAVRGNEANQFMANYLFKNDFGVSVWDGNRWPGMLANNFTANWFVENTRAHFWMQDPPDELGQRMAALTGNFYDAQRKQPLIIWQGKGEFTNLEAFRRETGEEPTGAVHAPSDRELEVVKFRLPCSSHRGVLLPMVGNARLMRFAPSGAAGGRPYFWRQGDVSSWSFGDGVSGPWSPTSGIVQSSYPNLPRLWAEGGAQLLGIEAIRLPVAQYGEEKRMGIKINGIKPEAMHPIADGWLTPSLPTMTGTTYRVTFKVRGENVKPLSQNDGAIAMAIWTNDTGQENKGSYILGIDDTGKQNASVPPSGTFPWTQISGGVTAPEHATRVRFLLGLRRSSGLVAYNDIWIETE
jgi:hypothetical protein